MAAFSATPAFAGWELRERSYVPQHVVSNPTVIGCAANVEINSQAWAVSEIGSAKCDAILQGIAAGDGATGVFFQLWIHKPPKHGEVEVILAARMESDINLKQPSSAADIQGSLQYASPELGNFDLTETAANATALQQVGTITIGGVIGSVQVPVYLGTGMGEFQDHLQKGPVYFDKQTEHYSHTFTSVGKVNVRANSIIAVPTLQYLTGFLTSFAGSAAGTLQALLLPFITQAEATTKLDGFYTTVSFQLLEI